MNLRSVDLNLLTVFDAVYTERSMSRAAEKIGMSQPALSLAISRFRQTAGDELFERTGRGVRPTPKAEELADPVRRALLIIRDALNSGEEFHAETSDRSFTVMLGDYGDLLYLPGLLRHVAVEAPQVKIRALRLNDASHERDLYFESVDLVLWATPLGNGDDRFVSQQLGTDTNVCLVRQDHPALESPLSWEAYATARHAVLEMPESYGPTLVDRELWSRGLKRDRTVAVDNLLALPDILTVTDLVATLPHRIAQRFATTHALRILPSPIDIRTPIYLSWHRSQNNDNGHRWLRSKLIDSFEAIDETSGCA